MCRFLLFMGRDPILIADLLTRPQHSIINQSYDSRLRVDQRRPLNGDGFGIGYYLDNHPISQAGSLFHKQDSAFCEHSVTSPLPIEMAPSLETRQRVTIIGPSEGSVKDVIQEENREPRLRPQEQKGCVEPCHMPSSQAEDPMDDEMSLIKAYTMPGGPCVFTSILPAWNNLNLIRMSEKIRSRLVFAHVRAASPGFPIAETNCHPWCYGKFLWMHNGFITQFPKVKRQLQMSLRDELFHYVQGNTDSEWSFALFLNQFDDPLHGTYSATHIKDALLRTIQLINQWSKEAGIVGASLLNFAVSDGRSVVCSRYTNSKTAEPASLFYSSGSRFEQMEPGRYKMVKSDKREDIIVVSSEPLTYERADWMTVPPNTVIVVKNKLNVLTYPVDDEYFNLKRERVKPMPGRQATWG